MFRSDSGDRSAASGWREPPSDAAHWFARMQSGDVSEEDRRSFEAWRTADPANDQAYRRLGYLWEATLAVPEQRLRQLMEGGGGRRLAVLPPSGLVSRRRLGLGLAGAGALAAVAGLAGTTDWFGTSQVALTLATRKGERRQAALPDGSVLTLNTDTLAVVRFDETTRLVTLQRGEAFFDVRADATRPFVVEAGPGRVTVTGTRFNVRRDADAAQVSVESGSVLVESGRWWRHAAQRLAPGQQTLARYGKGLSTARTADVGSLAAWQRGKVIFDNVPLAHVIDEMNRYLPHPARLDASSLRQHHVSGVFNVDDPGALIQALPAMAPVRVFRMADGQLRVVAR